MLKEYLSYFYDVYTLPCWLFIIAVGLFMIFNDYPKLLQKNKRDAMIIKVLGFTYIIGSTVVFIFMKVMR